MSTSLAKMSRDEPLKFQKYSRDYKKIFNLSEFIENYDDFTLFLKKYEAIQEKAKELNRRIDKNELIKKLVEKLNLSDEKQAKMNYPLVKSQRGFALEQLHKFQLALLSYLDFKEKDKAAKLKKLKELQDNLPVAKFREQILKSVEESRVTIIAGDTGCGKSTQIPRYLMDGGYDCIACTQPRRLACIALSKRVAFETQNRFGDMVGYQIRFEKKRRKETKIVFITEGLLLRQVSQDPLLADYNVIVLDEIHERHLHGDFLLGVLKCLLFQRDDFKLVLMSATINIKLFSDYFGEAARIIQVPGRLHPIKVNFSAVPAELDNSKTKVNVEPYVRLLHMIDQKYQSSERGDLLIFVSGLNEINSIIDAINQYNEKAKKWIVLPLHSSLSISEQDKVFDYAPEGMRKCVVSTNIAETSVTIDGIRFVIDSGFVKEMSYDPVCKMQRLKEFWVSKASAEQRKGRAGRTGPGVCFRLYTEDDYNAMADYTSPEIQRVPLDSLVLQMISMGLPDARKFPFVEPPAEDSIENTIVALKEHGALTEDEKITPTGELLSKLPVDIPIGKMLISGTMFHQIEPALSMAASLSVQTPLTNRAYRDSDCETLRKDLESDHGDPVTLLTCLREWLEVKGTRQERGAVSSRQWCRERGLEEQRFYEMIKIRSQFKDLLQDCNLLKADDKSALENMSSSERALRHGEVKLLRSLKRAHPDEDINRKKKFLKPDAYRIETRDEEEGHDIRDIDFRLRNNQTQLQNLISASTACSYKDLTILKVILCSGLYPQVAIGDEFNYCKGINDQLFHTKSKPFVFLHPMSYFGNHPDVLHLNDAHIISHPDFNSRNPLSAHHQVLFYMSLLETNKPYLVNTVRMPAAQSLLLFSNQICTNSNFTKIICDSWVLLRFPDSNIAERLCQEIVKIRTMWDRLAKLRIEGGATGTLETDLSDNIIKIVHFLVPYAVKRILPADLKTSFVGSGRNHHSGTNPLVKDSSLTPNKKYGGTHLTPYLIYDCLIDTPILEDWSCPYCELNLPLNSLQKMQHVKACKPEDLVEENNKIEEKPTSSNPNAVGYYCDVCDKHLILTPIEVLKHKKSH